MEDLSVIVPTAKQNHYQVLWGWRCQMFLDTCRLTFFQKMTDSTCWFLMNWKAQKVKLPCLILSLVTWTAVNPHVANGKLPCSFFQLSVFEITCYSWFCFQMRPRPQEKTWCLQMEVVRTRARFNSLLRIKHLTKMTLARSFQYQFGRCLVPCRHSHHSVQTHFLCLYLPYPTLRNISKGKSQHWGKILMKTSWF